MNRSQVWVITLLIILTLISPAIFRMVSGCSCIPPTGTLVYSKWDPSQSLFKFGLYNGAGSGYLTVQISAQGYSEQKQVHVNASAPVDIQMYLPGYTGATPPAITIVNSVSDCSITTSNETCAITITPTFISPPPSPSPPSVDPRLRLAPNDQGSIRFDVTYSGTVLDGGLQISFASSSSDLSGLSPQLINSLGPIGDSAQVGTTIVSQFNLNPAAMTNEINVIMSVTTSNAPVGAYPIQVTASVVYPSDMQCQTGTAKIVVVVTGQHFLPFLKVKSVQGNALMKSCTTGEISHINVGQNIPVNYVINTAPNTIASFEYPSQGGIVQLGSATTIATLNMQQAPDPTNTCQIPVVQPSTSRIWDALDLPLNLHGMIDLVVGSFHAFGPTIPPLLILPDCLTRAGGGPDACMNEFQNALIIQHQATEFTVDFDPTTRTASVTVLEGIVNVADLFTGYNASLTTDQQLVVAPASTNEQSQGTQILTGLLGSTMFTLSTIDPNSINKWWIPSATTTLPYITLSQTTIAQNSFVLVTGNGFTPNGNVSICISTANEAYSSQARCVVCYVPYCGSDFNSLVADSNGSFSYNMYVRDNIPVGPQQVWARDMALGLNTAYVTVTVAAPT